MLGKRLRLSSLVKPRFTKVFTASLFVIKLAQNEKGSPRIRIVVSKKVSRKAVERNRAKRLLSLCLGEYVKKIKGYDILFIVKKEILGKGQEVICQELSTAFLSGGVL